MKFWKDIITSRLTFEEGRRRIEKCKPYYMTRPEWEGIHFYNKKGQYCILFKDGHVEENMLVEVWDTDKNDWMTVTITEEATKILLDLGMIDPQEEGTDPEGNCPYCGSHDMDPSGEGKFFNEKFYETFICGSCDKRFDLVQYLVIKQSQPYKIMDDLIKGLNSR